MLAYIGTFLLGIIALEDQIAIKFPQFRGIIDKIKPFRFIIIIIGAITSLLGLVSFSRYSLALIIHGNFLGKLLGIVDIMHLLTSIVLVTILSLPYLKTMGAKNPEQVKRLEDLEEKNRALKPKLGYLAIILSVIIVILLILI